MLRQNFNGRIAHLPIMLERVVDYLRCSIVAEATQTKCACNPCLCNVSLETAVLKDGKGYCSQACADGHPNGQVCGRSGCTCSAT
jgi:metallothionein